MPFEILGRTVEIAREDWILVFIGVVVAASLAYGFLSSSDGFTPETELERYCVNVSASVEANSSISDAVSSCTCIPPGQFDEDRFQTDENVENATELFLVQCDLEQGDTYTIPVRRIKDGYGDNINETNVSGTGIQ